MERNNFEKNVKQKMDELKIPPSDLVWANLEKKISRKEKNRKWILFFFLFFLILSAGYWFISPLKNDSNRKSEHTTLNQNSKPINSKDSSSYNLAVTGEIQKINPVDKLNHSNSAMVPQKEFTKIKKNYSKTTNNRDSYFHRSLIKPEKKITENSQVAKAQTSKKIHQDFSKDEPASVETTRNSPTSNALNQSKNIQPGKNDTVEEKNKPIKAISENTSSENYTTNEEKQNRTAETIKDSSSYKKSGRTDNKNHWLPGFTLSAGTSQFSNGSTKGSAAYLSSPGNSAGGYTGNYPGYTYYPPSAFKPSIAFSAGFFIEKNVSRKSKISFGFIYKYFSVSNKVGNRIDSSNSSQNLSSNFYSARNSIHSHINNFQFLEVPVSLKFKLNKSPKLPLEWNAGINISELINSNALQFDYGSSVYYHHNDLFKKFQFGLHTGFSATLFTSGKRPFTFGPSFYYSLTNLSGKGLYENRHFGFVEINAAILLRKK